MSMRDSFAGITLQRGGYRNGAKVLEFYMEWLMVHQDLGHRPSMEEFAEWWNISLATAYRQQATFREVWPEFLTPTDVAVTLGLDPANPKLPMPYALGNPLAQEG